MNKTIFVDVHDTLIRTYSTKRIPIQKTIEKVKELFNDGYTLYLWSYGGKEYCKEIAAELKLTEYFDGYMSKPSLMIDDMRPEQWKQLTVTHPNELRLKDEES